MRYEVLKYTRFRDMRADMNLSQKQVAEHLNIAQNTLSQYENGERNIPNEIAVKLAVLYNTSLDYLFGLTDSKKPYPRKKPKGTGSSALVY